MSYRDQLCGSIVEVLWKYWSTVSFIQRRDVFYHAFPDDRSLRLTCVRPAAVGAVNFVSVNGFVGNFLFGYPNVLLILLSVLNKVRKLCSFNDLLILSIVSLMYESKDYLWFLLLLLCVSR